MKQKKRVALRAELREGRRLLLRASADDLATLRERVDAFLEQLKGEGYAGLRRSRAAKRPQSTRKRR